MSNLTTERLSDERLLEIAETYMEDDEGKTAMELIAARAELAELRDAVPAVRELARLAKQCADTLQEIAYFGTAGKTYDALADPRLTALLQKGE